MKQKVVPIRRKAGPQEKIVASNQKAVDDLPYNSGTWRVGGVPGLYVRARARSKSFFVQRRVRGRLARGILGEITLKAARAEAAKRWTRMKPVPAGGRKTFQLAFEEFLERDKLGERTREIYKYNVERYLADWTPRALEDIGRDRSGLRSLYHAIARKHGKASASQTMRMFSAVYRYARKVDADLPESPTVAVDLPEMKARDWALAPADLHKWWAGVKPLNPIKRTWWLACLFTGARRGSIEALKWADVDFEKRTITFRVTKGDRPYIVPMADKLAELLTGYRDSGEVPPSEWCFPSPVNPESHLVNVRDDKRGVLSAHHLRHTFRTTLAELGATPDQARLLMGHSLGGDVSRGYITAPLVVESLRPVINAVAARYAKILGESNSHG
ncbi:MAG: tyrosine-type recombinase/integrase [Bryobacteraceae bacterium]|nr:tyrosine-type recombinase/integrase [Bryobacteraceae bacterium]